MFIKFLCNLSIPFLLLSPCNDSYIIQIPNNVNLAESGSFLVNVVENNLSDNQTLYIDFDDEFTLKDSHGKADIIGHTSNNNIVVECNDTSSKEVSYSIGEIPVGEWNGSLGLKIRLATRTISNMLIDGRQINSILASLRPNYVEFSNAVINQSYDYDISLAQDESVLLYEIDEETVIISNNSTKPILANSDLSEMFKGIDSIIEIRNLDLIDMSYCENISSMFEQTYNLNSISGINNINTSNIKDMSALFKDATKLTSINLSNWNTSNVINMSNMFNSTPVSDLNCIGNWDTSKVKDISYMFHNTRSLSNLNINSWNLSSVENMNNMFSSNRGLTSIDLSNLNVSNCKDFSYLFNSCNRLTSIAGLNGWNTSNAENMAYMFNGCSRLNNIGDISAWNVGNVNNMAYMFQGIKASSVGNISSWNVANVETFEGMFSNCNNYTDISYVTSWPVSNKCQNLSSMFYNMKDRLPSTFDLSLWDVSNVTTTSKMFSANRTMEYLNITGWNTANLLDASSMFEYVNRINPSLFKNIIGIENINTSNLVNISSMFTLNELLNIDVSLWDTSSMQDISYAFSGCRSQDLSKLNNWNVSNVTNKEDCFADDAGTLSNTLPPAWYTN